MKVHRYLQSTRIRVEIEVPGGACTRRQTDDPMGALKDLLAEYRPVALPGLPRFAGGAVGHVGYDMVRTFERLPARAEDDLGLPDACLLVAESLLVFDNVAQKITVVSNVHLRDGDDPARAYDGAVARIEALVERLRQPAIPPAARPTEPGPVRANVTQETYERMVARAQEYIRAGDVIQVVLAQRFELPLATAPFNVYRCLRTVNPSPYMFYLELGDHTLAGASPEVMVRVASGSLFGFATDRIGSTSTDEDGAFTLAHVSPGKVKIVGWTRRRKGLPFITARTTPGATVAALREAIAGLG